jgi:hypothetical protein
MPRKMLLACAVLALSTGASAEWKKLNESPFGTMTYDTASVRQDQGRTRVTYRIDFPAPRKNAEGKTYLSASMDVAVDCKAATVMLVRLQTNAGSKGEGAVVDRVSVPPSAGEKVAPSSSNEAIFKVACPGAPVPARAAAAASSAPQPADAAPAAAAAKK